MAAVAEEAAVAAMQAFSAEQPLPQQPVPVFPRYGSRSRSLEQMQESARRNLLGSQSLEQRQEGALLHLNGPRSLEQRQESARRNLQGRSREQWQESARKAWATRRAAAAATAAQAGGDS